MKVYIVFKGMCSDRDVKAVFSSEENAVIYGVANDYDEIQEYEVDEIAIEGDARSVRWEVNYNIHTGHIDTYLCSSHPDVDDGTVIPQYCGWLLTYVAAKTRSEAIKKASDRFTKWRAEKDVL